MTAALRSPDARFNSDRMLLRLHEYGHRSSSCSSTGFPVHVLQNFMLFYSCHFLYLFTHTLDPGPRECCDLPGAVRRRRKIATGTFHPVLTRANMPTSLATRSMNLLSSDHTSRTVVNATSRVSTDPKLPPVAASLPSSVTETLYLSAVTKTIFNCQVRLLLKYSIIRSSHRRLISNLKPS
ncbi:hypothetical protein CC2G_002105 [Coprinopsis cinerea AmutBmut pab1-1]|nr:hypothetical protein CC2G_002105 [Coprinopsis cinerea AmutBmut pab1-1]